MAGYKIPGHKEISIKNEMKSYLNPKHVFIPLIVGMDTEIKPIKNINDKVLLGEPLGIKEGKFEIPVLSSVSGTIIDIEDRPYITDKPAKIMVIENDFKDTKYQPVTRDMNNITKPEFISILKHCGICGMSGSAFPTYAKFQTDQHISTLIINGVECEPYLSSDYTLMKKHYREILEAIETIIKINNIDKAILAVKDYNKDLLDNFKKYNKKSNIEFKTTKNYYPAGYKQNLIYDLLKIKYSRETCKERIIVCNVSSVFAIYNALKYNLPVSERIVTFTGEALNNPCNVQVKIGTDVNEVIEFLGGTKNDNYILISGGPMMGNHSVDKNLVIMPHIGNILVKEYNPDIPTECLRCGKCTSVCPAGLSPVLIKDNFRNKEYLEKLEPNRCISCGLCSYICPAKIDVRDKVRKASLIVRGGK